MRRNCQRCPGVVAKRVIGRARKARNETGIRAVKVCSGGGSTVVRGLSERL